MAQKGFGESGGKFGPLGGKRYRSRVDDGAAEGKSREGETLAGTGLDTDQVNIQGKEKDKGKEEQSEHRGMDPRRDTFRGKDWGKNWRKQLSGDSGKEPSKDWSHGRSKTLEGQRPEVVVVTGASAGVGRAVAREFAKHGAMVGLMARGRAGLEGAARDVEALGGRALILQCDVADAAAVEAAAARVEREFGPIDVWVNNAMCSVFSPVIEMTAAEYKRVTEVTYLGFVHGTLAALKSMVPRDRGTIVQVGSALTHRSIPLQSAYCAAKHAMKGFTESLRTEIDHDRRNIRVNMVHLPAMNTPQFGWVKTRMPRNPQPVPPIYEPEVAARAIYWSAHHDRRELLVGYPTVEAVFGEKFIPGLLDKYLGRTGYDAQQTEEPATPERIATSNVFAPVDEERDHGAHGTFEGRATDSSPQTFVGENWPWLGAAALAWAAVGVGAWALLSRESAQDIEDRIRRAG